MKKHYETNLDDNDMAAIDKNAAMRLRSITEQRQALYRSMFIDNTEQPTEEQRQALLDAEDRNETMRETA